MNATSLHDGSIYIVGVGAQTPVGMSAPETAAAVRCGISRYGEHPYMIDKHGERMIVARAEWLDESFTLEDRIVSLAVGAAREALQPIERLRSSVRGGLRVHLAISAENLPETAQRQRVLDRFIADAGLTNSIQGIETVVEGHAGGLLALENAVRQLFRGEAQICLVGGADSWLDPEQLEAIDYSGRLHSENNSWGFTPGEGAGFCLVTTGAIVRRLALTPLAEILGVATAHETKTMGTKTVCIGEGLTDAFRGVLDPNHRVSHTYCDFNGETYRANEYGIAVCRTSEHFEDGGRFTAAADCWGDVGVASGTLAITLPLVAWSRGYSRGEVTMAWNSSASRPLRAAVLLIATTGSTN